MSAIHIARMYMKRGRNYVGQHFRARVHFVYTVGRDEAMRRDYTRYQEKEDRRFCADEFDVGGTPSRGPRTRVAAPSGLA